MGIYFRDPFVYGLSQWETTLQCNDVSHWLSPCIKWSLYCSHSVFYVSLCTPSRDDLSPRWTHRKGDKVAAISQETFSNGLSLTICSIFGFKFIDVCCQGFIKAYASVYWLVYFDRVLIRQKAIIWNDVGLVYWRIFHHLASIVWTGQFISRLSNSAFQWRHLGVWHRNHPQLSLYNSQLCGKRFRAMTSLYF